tara:strand:- start:483 stop:686 length:204 start_codon:yes stop_codon:yes gene_type:complete
MEGGSALGALVGHAWLRPVIGMEVCLDLHDDASRIKQDDENKIEVIRVTRDDEASKEREKGATEWSS